MLLKPVIDAELNPSQRDAVSALSGPVLVIAGAGSGKTMVIEYRVLHLVETGVPPDSILLLTFTRRAASEMLSRAAARNPGCMRVEGGTFHSFAYKWLKSHSAAIGYPRDFTVLDEGDSSEAISRCCTKLGLSAKTGHFPRKRTLKKILSASVNKGIGIGDVLFKEYPHFSGCADDIEKLEGEYRAFKREKAYMDYDDLLVFFKGLLEGNAAVREKISKKYRYVMVDEYQDTNSLQGDITCLMAGSGKNIMVVGDDAQSIYGFRGANHENIMKFPEKFPGCRIIKLEINYRSTQPVLDLANTVLEEMEHKYSKCLVSRRGKNGSMPGIMFFENAYREAEWIADRVSELREAGIPPAGQGVLFRSSSVSIRLQAELARRGVPFRVFGGLKFYETSHVKDVLSVMRIVACYRDELAWHRSLMLIDGIGTKTADKILNEAVAAPGLKSFLAGGLAGYTEGFRFSAGLKNFERVLSRCSPDKMSVADNFRAVMDYYTPVMKQKFDDWPGRMKDLTEIMDMASRYDSVDKFLADFTIDSPGRGELSRESDDTLTLSTVHSAKGLEWEAVFFMGLVEGVLPVGYAAEDRESVEEEHRLFYVGITRARTHLCLTAHLGRQAGWDSGFGSRVSRFVESRGVLGRVRTLNRAGL